MLFIDDANKNIVNTISFVFRVFRKNNLHAKLK